MAQRPFEGDLATTIAEPLDSDPSTVRGWVQRLNREGIAGLNDRPRSGRPRLAEPRAWKGSLSEQAPMGCPSPGAGRHRGPSCLELRSPSPAPQRALTSASISSPTTLCRKPRSRSGWALRSSRTRCWGSILGVAIVLPLGLDLEG